MSEALIHVNKPILAEHQILEQIYRLRSSKFFNFISQ